MTTSIVAPANEMIFGALPIEPEEIVELLGRTISYNTVAGFCRPTKKNPLEMENPRTHTTPWTRGIYCTLKEHLEAVKGQAVFTNPEGKKSERSEEHTSELQSPCNLVC